MKLVREYLFEIVKGNSSGISSIGLGKSNLIKKWLDEKGITNYTIVNGGIIDIKGNLCFAELAHGNLSSPKIEFFPDFIQFGTVYGSFNISGCGMLHLRGCPIKVTKNFDCSENELNSLDYCPKYVGGEFVCYNNIDIFTKNDVKSKCKVERGIFITSADYYDLSPDYNQMITNGIKGM